MAAAVGAGLYESYEQAVRQMVRVSDRVLPRLKYKGIYEKKYLTYRKIVEALNPVWEQI